MSETTICNWVQDEDGVYETDCEHMFEFVDGGPSDNDFSYCPYCGNKLQEIKCD